MNRTWKSIKRDSNKTKIYLTIALLSDEVFDMCPNLSTETGQKWIVLEIDDFESTREVIHIDENGRSFELRKQVVVKSDQ